MRHIGGAVEWKGQFRQYYFLHDITEVSCPADSSWAWFWKELVGAQQGQGTSQL